MLHVYTQDEFDALPIIDGRRKCPTGDYTKIKSFGKCCSFGKWCSLGESCSFGKCCSFGKSCSFENGFEAKSGLPFVACGYIGSRQDTTYLYNFVTGLHIRCGCWFGPIDEFQDRVASVHGDTKYGKQYQLAIQLAKVTFE